MSEETLVAECANDGCSVYPTYDSEMCSKHTDEARRSESLAVVKSIVKAMEDDPEIPSPFDNLYFRLWSFMCDDPPAMMRRIRKAIGGSWDKEFDEHEHGDMRLAKQAGGTRVVISVDRDTVCTPRVVGTETVTVKKYPEHVEYEEVEEQKDIIEWDCPPMGDDDE